MPKLNAKETARFWSKVAKSSDDKCWNWIGVTRSGYGVFTYSYITHLAHRVSYLLSFGPIPNNLFICHKCDNSRCVNPNHLYAGTQFDNMKDRNQGGFYTRVARVLIPTNQ